MVDLQPSTRERAAPRSPLDPFVVPFLHQIDGLEGGYAPGSHGRAVAVALDWQPAFVEALFASARVRGLLEPFYGKRSRGHARWRVSPLGRAWLSAMEAAGRQGVA